MSLPLADIKRGKVQSFRDVADALDGMAGANRDMKQGVERLPIMGDGWKGVSGEAAHHDLDAHGKYLDGHAQAQQSAAAKIRAAADEFEGVQQLLKKIENDAAQGKFTINYDTGEVTPPSGKYDKNELDYLTNTLRQISAAGGVANADLEAAVKAAQTLPDPSGAAAQSFPAMPGSTIKPGGVAAGLEHLAAPDPNADPGATKAAAAGTDTQANYKEWYPKTPGSGDKLTIDPSKAGSLTGTVGALEKLPGAPKPQDGFGSGVARQFGQGVNSRVDGIIDEAKNLTGQGGPGSPGVAESWAKFALGTADQMANPLGSLPGEVKDAVNDPAGFAGKKLFDVSSIAATGPLGGEAAAGARGLLGDANIAGRGGLLDPPTLPHDTPPAVGHTPAEAPSSPTHLAPGSEHSPAGGDNQVSADHDHSLMDAHLAPIEHPHSDSGGGSTYKERLDQTPINNGQWEGERGESKWLSHNPEVNQHLNDAGVDGIHYGNARPDFSPVTKGEVEIPNMTTSRDANFKTADELLGREWGMSRKEVEIWRKLNGFTWHEEPNMTTMQLIPTVVNGKLGHIGGIGELNRGAVPPIGEVGP
ncbi:endonuclease [Mycobacteroides abscessus]|uniref:HNH endonuclease n=1 Tax=Mycobacteroides abscessus TaxID=36809 RepID=UPI000E677EE8|nr:endonuclease [Mycobacteroides abscessus]